MKEVKIPNTEYVVIVQPNGHLMVCLKEVSIGHIQFKVGATDDEVIEAAKYCFNIKISFKR